MNHIIPHKLAACRFDYEYMGRSLQELNVLYGFPIALLEQHMQDGHWERKIEPTELPEVSDISNFAKALEETTRSKLSVIALFRQIENQPMIAQLEKVFLNKALELASNLDAMDDKSAVKLKNLIEAVGKLQDRNPVVLADQLAAQSKGDGGKVVVQIANNIQ